MVFARSPPCSPGAFAVSRRRRPPPSRQPICPKRRATLRSPDVERLLLIPAAGTGSRLGADVPKLLVPVAGRPMIEHLLDLYAGEAERVVIVVSPSARSLVAGVRAARWPSVSLVVQETPTGMLDAILLARGDVEAARPRRILITWCDQIAVSRETVARVAAAARTEPEPALVLPTCRGPEPYVHLRRDAAGAIVQVLHRREGDAMPAQGESDAGVFDLSADSYLGWLTAYAREPEIGARTGERNFVPFVAYASRRGRVVTVPCAEAAEALGINTPGDLALVEAHLLARNPR
jgi:bifunctional UDP-N-acetylglucosamine pyrophosphorylase/glucosamine-1-phosphate N-acetyltransferase